MSIIRLEESKVGIEKGERRSDPSGIETEVQALEHENIEFLKDGEVIRI